jgi:predicted RNase H-like HicB family nuclease
MQAAMQQAHYEFIEEDGVIFATIPHFDGLWATGKTHEEAESVLASVLEGWLLVGLAHQHPLPIVAGLDLTVHAVA